METNFTPLNIEKLKGEDNRFNTILLLIATLTMMVLAVMLFVLIQKKIQTINQDMSLIPTVTIVPTEKPIQTVEESPTPTSLPMTAIDVSPIIEATVSPTIVATESAQ